MTGPETNSIKGNLNYKTGSYYQKLRKNNLENEKAIQENHEYNHIKEIEKKMSKHSKTRISRSTLINNQTRDVTVPGSSNVSGSQGNLHKYMNEGYTHSVKFQKLPKGNQTSPKKGLRDFSTGAIRTNGQNSLSASKENGISYTR